MSARIASRMAARSTTAGTPVKSCISTRAGLKAISRSLFRSASHSAMPRMSSAVTVRPSSWRSRFSSSTLSEKGKQPDIGEAVRLRLLQAEIVIAALADFQRAPAIEAVERGLRYRCQLGSPRAQAHLARTGRHADDMQRRGQSLGREAPARLARGSRGSIPDYWRRARRLYKSACGGETMREKCLRAATRPLALPPFVSTCANSGQMPQEISLAAHDISCQRGGRLLFERLELRP